jgi:phosphoribosylaminoimidazolecarboxamide formyltransferase/IMP cyclohydrolase
VIKEFGLHNKQFRSILNGVIVQDRDAKTETEGELRCVTKRTPSQQEIQDLLFANKLVKHTKSNAIVLARNNQLISSGVGQTSRVDALKQAIVKAKGFGFDLKGAVMASDAFFPFPDCVEIADAEGVAAVIQPGGSVRDQESIDYCDSHDMAMVLTGIRHFKH